MRKHGLAAMAFSLSVTFAYGQDAQQQKQERQDQAGLSQGPATQQTTPAGEGHPGPLLPPDKGQAAAPAQGKPGPLLPPDKDPYNFNTLSLEIQGVEPAVVQQIVSVSADGKYTFTTQKALSEPTVQQGQLSTTELESLKHAYGPLGESESVPSKLAGNGPFPGASTFKLNVNGGLRTSGTIGADKDSTLNDLQKKEWALVTPVLAKLESLMNAKPAPAPKDETVVGTLQVHTEGTGLGDPPHLVYTLSIDPPKAGQSNTMTVKVTADGIELLRDLGGAVGKPVQLTGQVSGDSISISKGDDFKVVSAAPRVLTAPAAAPSQTTGLVGGVQKADLSQQKAPTQQQAAKE